jgi:hypothetical protein
MGHGREELLIVPVRFSVSHFDREEEDPQFLSPAWGLENEKTG